MSWEHFESPVVCQDCGHKGSYICSENDWFQSNVTWIGFGFREIRTKKPGTGNASCLECGSGSIEIKREKGQYVRPDRFGEIGRLG